MRPILLAWLPVLAARAQTVPDPIPDHFDVASVRRHIANDEGFMYRGLPGGGLHAIGVTVKMLLMEAYGVRAFQISGGPAWINTDRWDIEGKVEGLAGRLTLAQHGVMVRALLEDRFQLKVHRETRRMPVFHLVIAKGGAKFTGPPDPSNLAPSIHVGIGNIVVKRTDLRILIETLERQLWRTVIDKTNLTGQYDYSLKWAPQPGEGGPESIGLPPLPQPTSAPSDGPTIFTALQQQLGLRLKSAKGPVELIVIEGIEKPSPN